jgi:hypothetical protein
MDIFQYHHNFKVERGSYPYNPHQIFIDEVVGSTRLALMKIS